MIIKKNKQILIISFFISILWIIFSYFFIQSRVSDLKEQKLNEISNIMKHELATLIEEKTEAVLLIALSISNNPDLKEVFHKTNKKLNLNEFSQTLRKSTSLKNIWFQIISKDGISLYRSWTDKNGDDLTKARLDVAQMIINPQQNSTISTGKFDLSFKSMLPIYDEGKFIGFIEVLAKFNSIAIKMENKGYDIAVLVDKKYKKQLSLAFTKKFIQDYYIANLNIKDNLLSLIKDKNVSYFLGDKKYHIFNDKNHIGTTYHLKDINGKEMAYFLLFHDMKNIDTTQIIQMKDRLILFFFIIFLFIIISTYYLYLKKYKNFIKKLNIRLEHDVVKKTQEIQKQSNKLEHIANHDALTGLPNRLLFLDRLEQAIRHAQRNTKKFSVLFLDLDRFKEVNDTYGHGVGDKLLQEVSRKLISCVRKEDSISRLGGDEFTMILQDIYQNDITKITNKIIETMQEKITINQTDIYTTFSIGISKYPEDGETPDILIRNADTAMYRAKDMGKNQYQFYNQAMTVLAIARTKIESDLRLALLNNEFIAYYQPKIDARTNTVIGMEALLRWQHPKLGFITPDRFILIAEETGLIIPIDQWMMKHTIGVMKDWHDEGLNTGKLSLNLSIKQLENKECAENLTKLTSSIQISSKYIELEVTESQIMTNPEFAISILNKIRDLGISISVDDFGTGYSSLSYLKKLPIDKLKIDREFVKNLPDDEHDVAIVRAIIALANSLNLELIAEGVETKEQLDFLVKEGCPNIQGYYYSKPLSADDYKEFLLKYQ